jgi:hypothetical protein
LLPEFFRHRVMAAVDGGLGAYSGAPLFRISVSHLQGDWPAPRD